jgi:hypothetical protein
LFSYYFSYLFTYLVTYLVIALVTYFLTYLHTEHQYPWVDNWPRQRFGCLPWANIETSDPSFAWLSSK